MESIIENIDALFFAVWKMCIQILQSSSSFRVQFGTLTRWVKPGRTHGHRLPGLMVQMVTVTNGKLLRFCVLPAFQQSSMWIMRQEMRKTLTETDWSPLVSVWETWERWFADPRWSMKWIKDLQTGQTCSEVKCVCMSFQRLQVKLCVTSVKRLINVTSEVTSDSRFFTCSWRMPSSFKMSVLVALQHSSWKQNPVYGILRTLVQLLMFLFPRFLGEEYTKKIQGRQEVFKPMFLGLYIQLSVPPISDLIVILHILHLSLQ